MIGIQNANAINLGVTIAMNMNAGTNLIWLVKNVNMALAEKILKLNAINKSEYL